MSQVEVAELLGRHKSWVCRRLALIERLGPKAKDELRVGLLSPTAARQIVRLPQGNQAEVLEAIRREALSERGIGRRGGPVAAMRRTTASNSTSWRILAKRCRRPRECSRRCAIRG